MSKPTLTVVSDVGNQRAATVAGIAAMEFDGVKGFARMPQEKRNANVRGLATRAYHAALVASDENLTIWSCRTISALFMALSTETKTFNGL